MTTYYAAVKYAVDATDAEKVRALKDGIEWCACELIGFGVSVEEVSDVCERAIDTAADEAQINAFAAEEESRG